MAEDRPIFPATRWSLVGRAGAGPGAGGQPAVGEIIRLYAPALRAHLVQSMRVRSDRADDLLQSFLTDKVLEQQLVGLADPQRGWFRTFLLTALERFVIDEHRHQNRQKRAPTGELFDVDEQRDSLTDRNAPWPSDSFDLAWAKEVVGEVLDRMRAACDPKRHPHLWTVFEARYLRPATEDLPPEPHESLAQRLGLPSPQHAANLLITAKRMFTRIFTSVVARYATDETEAHQEIQELWAAFARRR